MFTITSRYYGIPRLERVRPDGTRIVYVRRRFVPPPERFALLQERAVVEGDRHDTVAAQYLGDPEQFWRVADANGVMRPEELTETVGRRVRITLPDGVPGVRGA